MRRAQNVLVCGEEVFQGREKVSGREVVLGVSSEQAEVAEGRLLEAGAGFWIPHPHPSRVWLLPVSTQPPGVPLFPLPLLRRHTRGWDGGAAGCSEVGFGGV